MTDQDFTQEEYDQLPVYVPLSGDKHYVDIRLVFNKRKIIHDHGVDHDFKLDSLQRLQTVGLDEDNLNFIADHFRQSDLETILLSGDIGNIISDGGSYQY